MQAVQASYCPLPHPELEAVKRMVLSLLTQSDAYTLQQEPWVHHVQNVVGILTELNLDATSLEAGLLFALDWQKLQNFPELSKDSLALAQATHKLYQTARQFEENYHQPQEISEKPQHESIEAFRKMLLACAQDIRAVIILLASLLQDLRWHAAQKTKPAHHYAHHILHLYAPLANRLGIWQLKWELEDLSFRFLEEQAYRQIASLLDEKRIERQTFIQQMEQKLALAMKEGGIQAEIKGRAKHIYSIWKKMHGKNLSFSHLYDVRAFRIIVEKVNDCYAALGIVHHLWLPIPKEFDDYISQPKPNGYQSLHTVVIADDGRAVEVQIRTQAMHQAAEFGLAAHWFYKEAGAKAYGGQQLANQAYDAKISLLRQLLEWKDETGTVIKTLDKNAWVDDHIYVFTPQAKVVALPVGATALDFAYHIHTDMGHRCRGARVNGKMVPLHTPLENTQTVEIITVKSGGPSRDWLQTQPNYVISARAKSKIRAWFNALDMEESIQKGRGMLEKFLQREGKTAVSLDYLAQALHCKNAQQMLLSIAKEDLTYKDIQEALLTWVQQKQKNADKDKDRDRHERLEYKDKHEKFDKSEFDRQDLDKRHGLSDQFFIKTRSASHASNYAHSSNILISGVATLAHQLARCCKPVAGDAICGFITRGKGVSIHREDCATLAQLAKKNRERLIESTWAQIDKKKTYPCDISIQAHEHKHLMHDIHEILARYKIKIIEISTRLREQKFSIYLQLEVEHVDTLNTALQQLKQVRGIYRLERGLHAKLL